MEHASQLLDNIYRFYYSSSCPCGQELFYETYPPTNEVITYKTNGETLEHEKMAYFWHMSSMFSGVNALLECTGSSRYIHLLENSILPMMECYYDTIRTPHAFQTYPTVFGRADRYYDDNIWIGMEFLKLYELTDNKEYLGKAESIWTFVESGIDNVLDGGVYWCEQKKFSKNTCSNAPAVVLALKLYKVTKKEEYLEKGKQLYRWVKSRLQDSNDGLCYDKVLLDGQVEQTKYTYNSGQMLQAASLFYQLTGKEEYLQEARKIAEGCRARFFDVTGDGSESVRMLKNGNVWFIAVMLRGFLELYHIDGNPTYINDYKTTLKWLWENGRDGKGLFEDNCLAGPAYYGKKDKYLLTQGALVEMYARLSAIN
ncbi:MAG: glycoside hydrolase family 76 protein [Bacteroidales bacterium]|nr:glycoside hydrolase family 76 protein [Bacteroidales bacterium]